MGENGSESRSGQNRSILGGISDTPPSLRPFLRLIDTSSRNHVSTGRSVDDTGAMSADSAQSTTYLVHTYLERFNDARRRCLPSGWTFICNMAGACWRRSCSCLTTDQFRPWQTAHACAAGLTVYLNSWRPIISPGTGGDVALDPRFVVSRDGSDFSNAAISYKL